jgi:hypothetical protein
MTFRQQRQIVSAFKKQVRQMGREADPYEGMIKRFTKIADDVLFDPASAKNLPPEAQNLLRNTNRVYKTTQEALETEFPEKLIAQLGRTAGTPRGVIGTLMPKNPDAIKRLRLSYTHPIAGQYSREGDALWKQMRTMYFADAVDDALKTGIAKPAALDAALKKIGPQAMNELVPDKAGKEAVKEIRNMFGVLAGKSPSGAALIVRGSQAGAAYTMYRGIKEDDYLQVAASGAVLLGPMAFVKLASTPAGRKMLTAGIKLKPGASPLVPIGARMANLLRKLETKEQRSLVPGPPLSGAVKSAEALGLNY